MLVLRKDFNGQHTTIFQCAKGVERKRRRMEAEEMQESVVRSFQSYGRLLETVTSFKYLVQVLTDSNENWTAVVSILRKVQTSWVFLSIIMAREGASTRVCIRCVI